MRLLPAVLYTGVLIAGVASPATAQDRPAPDEIEVRPTRVRATEARVEGDVRVEARAAERQTGAYLGVATSPPAPIVREQLRLAQGMGLVVDVVEKGSPAEQAGIKPYDVLTRLGDQLLVNGEQLAVLVRSRKPGDEIDLTLVRGGEPTRVTAKLIEHEIPPLEDILFFRGHQIGGHPPDGMRLPPDARVRPRPMPDRDGNAQRPGRTVVARTITTWSDGEHVLTVTTEPGEPRHLVAKDKHDAVLYDGDLDGEKVPTLVKEKLKKMQETGVQLPPAPPARDAERPAGKP